MMIKLADNKKSANLILIVSALLFIYWNIVQNIDIYSFPIVGALYEMTSILSLLAIFAIPIFLVFFIPFNKFKVLKQYYYALAIVSVLMILLFTIYS